MEWAKLWVDSIKAQKSLPKEMENWTDQMLATMKTWNETQAKFWEGMLESVQSTTPETLRQRMDEGAHTISGVAGCDAARDRAQQEAEQFLD
ncbi:MAG: hypothetical protein U0074_08410 [Kouleothrix sp.]